MAESLDGSDLEVSFEGDGLRYRSPGAPGFELGPLSSKVTIGGRGARFLSRKVGRAGNATSLTTRFSGRLTLQQDSSVSQGLSLVRSTLQNGSEREVELGRVELLYEACAAGRPYPLGENSTSFRFSNRTHTRSDSDVRPGRVPDHAEVEREETKMGGSALGSFMLPMITRGKRTQWEVRFEPV